MIVGCFFNFQLHAYSKARLTGKTDVHNDSWSHIRNRLVFIVCDTNNTNVTNFIKINVPKHSFICMSSLNCIHADVFPVRH